jgi:L-alanine-DL-glutamate epimerase-like enolase superfamily enzyme
VVDKTKWASKMKITEVETVLFQPRWEDSFADRHRRTLVAITLRTDEGVEGISRAWSEQVSAIHTLFKPLLIGEDPRNVERLWAKMEAATVPFLGRERELLATIGTLDIALWDLFGKAAGLPCWQLLGGYRDVVEAYADIPIRSTTPAGLAEELAECVHNGYQAVKFHILQRDPNHIVAETRAAREAIGSNIKLMVDIFRALDPRTAIDVAHRLEEFDVYWLEEPVRWHDNPLGLALVAQQTRIPIAGGENESNMFGCRALLERAGLAYLQTDTIGGGGYTPMRKIAALAEAYHVSLAPHGATFPELNAPLVAALPNGAMVPATTPQYPPAVWADLYEDFQIEQGQISLTSKPGLGLTFSQNYLASHRVEAIV